MAVTRYTGVVLPGAREMPELKLWQLQGTQGLCCLGWAREMSELKLWQLREMSELKLWQLQGTHGLGPYELSKSW